MSFSQSNSLLNDEFEYLLAFLTTKNGKSMRRLRTCKVVNLQFSFFSTPIWMERMFYMFHYTHNALNCTIIVIFCEKASQIGSTDFVRG